MGIRARVARLKAWLSPPSPPAAPARIRVDNVVIGTVGICNASCVHCPTGKAITDHVARGVMSMALFRSIIDQLAAPDCSISGFILLGLFGDTLLDPHLVERVEYVRAKLPKVALQISTNGAAYAREKHAVLKDHLDWIGVHIESLTPETYDELMAPLRLERVRPKVEMILDDFGPKTIIAMPLSRATRAEHPRMRAYFRERGAGMVLSLGLLNRCNPGPEFERLAIAPFQTRCPARVLDNLIVDWAGDLFMCCNDFQKERPIGDFRHQTLAEIWDSPDRAEVRRLMDEERWQDIVTCRKCWSDPELPAAELDPPVEDELSIPARRA